MSGLRRRLLMPLVPVYGAGLRLKKQMFEGGRLKAKSLPDAVISVGSLSAGGAGKTPVVLLLADLLRRREYAVRILTRGYGRESSSVERVDPEGLATRYGDEPLLLAQRSGLPVYVGADRYEAGMMAREGAGGRVVVHLLDDGFQHRKLARDLDVVLLTKEDVEDVLLPAGNLREPLSTLQDADVVVLREDEAEALTPVVQELTRDSGVPPLWQIRRGLEFTGLGEVPVPERPLAFCAIARPESFTEMLETYGCTPAEVVTFGDHHSYSERDITRLLERARESGADGFITTAKDAVKLTRVMRSRLEWVGPLVVPELRVELKDEKEVMDQMISMVSRMDRRKARG